METRSLIPNKAYGKGSKWGARKRSWSTTHHPTRHTTAWSMLILWNHSFWTCTILRYIICFLAATYTRHSIPWCRHIYIYLNKWKYVVIVAKRKCIFPLRCLMFSKACFSISWVSFKSIDQSWVSNFERMVTEKVRQPPRHCQERMFWTLQGTIRGEII